MSTPSPSLPGYENLELIGKGGFSRVYKADQSKLKREVAVKVLNFGLNDEADRVSFSRETELMGRVSTHPNIVTVHDTAFTAQGQPCIVMELYPGGSLADLINEVGRLNTREALEVGVSIASALHASHQSGVLHCDLKPQNILISKFGQPALGDFGISTFAEERTRTSQEAGAGFTLPYAAPEIVEGESPTVASDIYSLAATLYTSLCGRRPFAYPDTRDAKPTAAEHARRILLEPVPPLIADGVPPELDALISAAMSKEPSKRPASAAAFASAFHEIGQRLGLGTAAPRIADQGALPIIDAEAVGQGQIDLSMLVRERNLSTGETGGSSDGRVVIAEPSHDSTASGTGFGHRPVEASASRRQFARFGAVAAALIVAGILAFVTLRSGDDPEIAAPGTVPEPVATVASGPAVLAPSRPSDVEVERRGSTAVSVAWQAPEVDLAGGDVVYEIRRQDGLLDAPIIVMGTEAVIPAVANDEGVCVTVLAVRGNRAAAPTDPVCSTPLSVETELSSNTCSAPCQVDVLPNPEGSMENYSLMVVDRELNSMVSGGVTLAILAADGDGWSMAIDDSVPTGDYLLIIDRSDNTAESLLFTVQG